MEGLRNFIQVDNHRARKGLDVDQLNEGIRLFEVRRPKFEEEGAPWRQSGKVPRN